MAEIFLDTRSLEAYSLYLAIKRLPRYSFQGHVAIVPDEYMASLGLGEALPDVPDYKPEPFLFDYQRDIARLAIRKKKFAVFMEPGYGKGLLPECPVLTPSGFAPLSTLRVGDSVIGANGEPTKITGRYNRGLQEVFKVTFSDGCEVVCDGDHLWNVKSHNDHMRGKPWRTMNVRELLSAGLKTGSTIPKRNWRIPMVLPVRHPPRDLPIHPYLLGVLLGDGTINGAVSWCKPDVEIGDRVRPLLPAGVELNHHKPNDRASVWRITGVSHANPVLDSLRDLGLNGKRSWEKFVPPEYLASSVDQRLALLQGLMDTDGHAGGTPEFGSSSKMLIDAVWRLVESFGGTAQMCVNEEPSYVHNGEKRTGRVGYRLTMTFPPGVNPFSLPRKADAYKTASRGLGRWIESIERCGRAETICIKVAAPDGLLVIDRHVVTHNTLIDFEFAKYAAAASSKRILIVAPPNVIPQMLDECDRFYRGRLVIERVRANQLPAWNRGATQAIGITNYEAIREDTPRGNLGGLILSESSMLKSMYGKWGARLIEIGKGLEWKLCETGTPAPNDTIEYGNHAIFLDRFPTLNSFLARYFVNRGQTDNRWEMKPHAVRPFYRALSDWCIFVNRPASYGWRDNSEPLPPIIVHTHTVTLTDEQRGMVSKVNGDMFGTPKGITSRAKLSQLAKGQFNGEAVPTNKPDFIRRLVESWPEESTIVWCVYNHEQDTMEKVFPGAASIRGDTPEADRFRLLDEFRSGQRKILISKGKILGFGLNLQIATRQVFSGLVDCFDEATELLTASGWKSFGDVSVGDSVATVNMGTRAMEWQPCSRVVWQRYAGPMLHFKGQRNFDLLVTPNHKLLVERCPIRFPNSGRGLELIRADALAARFRRLEYRMLSVPDSFAGGSPKLIDIPPWGERQRWVNSRAVASAPTDQIVRLAGWYISEGHCRPMGTPEFGKIAICQTDVNPENRAEIIALMRSFGLNVNDKRKEITGTSRNLAAFLISSFGSGSANKFIPAWMKNLHPRHLVPLRDTMIRGDGCHQAGIAKCYRTTSPQLADDFQEICLKTGVRGSIHNRGITSHNGNHPVFDVTLAWKNTNPSIQFAPDTIHYEGMVGCVTVPNHTVIVRRNGIAVASGNSYETYFQCVKRSNRVGSTRPLNVHLPVTPIEEAMIATVLVKADRVQKDIEEQEAIYREGWPWK